MGPCPYCAEKVSPEARLCRFCNRPLLYSVSTTASLSEREKHEFLKIWNAIDFNEQKRLPLSTYSMARKELDKIPLTLAWDLNLQTADQISQKLGHLGIEKRLLGGLPRSEDFRRAEERTSRFATAAYFVLACVTIGGAAFMGLKFKQEHIELADDPSSEVSDQIAIPQPQNPSAPTPSAEQLFQSERQFERGDVDRLLSATVFIRGERSLGSGFLISSNGYILSNSHVTRDMLEPTVTFRDGRSFRARKIKEDERYDISLIKIDGGPYAYLELGNANEVYAGENVITIGNPNGLSFTITRGIVSYNGRIINETPYLQTDAAINPGNSGGPMINSSLKVIGINTMTSTSAQGISFALPINLACDPRGIAGELLSPCPRYSIVDAGSQNIQVSLDNRSPSPDHYQSTSKELYETYQREIQSLQQEAQKLEERNQALALELKRDEFNSSLRERIAVEQKSLQDKAQALERQSKESQLRYLDRMIELMERQALDPKYAPSRTQIEGAIASAMEKKKQIRETMQ
jgi:S1-C subfamily serine protease